MGFLAGAVGHAQCMAVTQALSTRTSELNPHVHHAAALRLPQHTLALRKHNRNSLGQHRFSAHPRHGDVLLESHTKMLQEILS